MVKDFLDKSLVSDEYAESLRMLLELRPRKTSRAPIILTAEPLLWVGNGLSNEANYVDITNLLTWPDAPSITTQGLTAPRPATAEDLRSLAKEHEPDWIIIDFSIPWQMYSDLAPGPTISWPDSYGTSELLPKVGCGVLERLLIWAIDLSRVRAVTTVAPGPLTYRPWFAKLRQYLNERMPVTTVLELPTNIWEIERSSSFLCFGQDPEPVYFNRVQSASKFAQLEQQKWFTSTKIWLNEGRLWTGDNEAYATKLDTLPWTFRANNPHLDKSLKELRRNGVVEALGSICNLIPGEEDDETRYRDALDEMYDSVDGRPIVDRRILTGEQLDLGTADRIRVTTESGKVWARFGDILCSTTAGEDTSFLVYKDSSPAIVAEGVIVIRLLATDRISSKYLADYLNSETAMKWILGRTPATLLSPMDVSDLSEVPVPLFHKDLLEEFTQLGEVVRLVHEKGDELEKSRIALFAPKDKNDFREKLGQIKITSRVLKLCLELSGDREFQILNAYPFPIAYSFRLLRSLIEPMAIYNQQVKVAENILRFLGGVALSVIYAKGLPVPEQSLPREPVPEDSMPKEEALQESLRKMLYGGLSFGQWREILRLCTKAFAAYPNCPFASEMRQLSTSSKSVFNTAMENLIVTRNDSHHGTQVLKGEALTNECDSGDQYLLQCLKELSFLSEYPVRKVCSVEVPRTRNGVCKCKCLRYMGDHPYMIREDLESQETFPTSDLIIDLGRDERISLFPFITVQDCTACHEPETCFIDKSPQTGTVSLRSFERGCCHESDEVTEALDKWWLPVPQAELKFE